MFEGEFKTKERYVIVLSKELGDRKWLDGIVVHYNSSSEFIVIECKKNDLLLGDMPHPYEENGKVRVSVNTNHIVAYYDVASGYKTPKGS